MMTREELDEYLVSDNTPEASLYYQELHGFLTGLCMFRQEVERDEIFGGVWRDADWTPSNVHENARAKDSILALYHKIGFDLESGHCHIELGWGEHCADWAQGVLFATELRQEKWAELTNSNMAWLAAPIRVFEKFNEHDHENIKARLSSHTIMPRHVIAIYRHFQGLPFEMAEGIELPSVGRNDPCPCGSGSKFKKCHGR